MLPSLPTSPIFSGVSLMERLTAVRQGFASISTDHALTEKALHYLVTWLTQADFQAYRAQLDWLIETKKWSILLDSFYQILPFGTGGRRGPVGIGPNRMNLWTLGASVQGHCDYLRERFPGVTPLRVVLGYDVRRFEDRRGVYHPELPNPVLHLSSRDFCEYAAGVYAGNGIESWILPADAGRYISTPELSFTIRYLRAHGGLNMTASHNPPDDNGSKFYTEHGSQPVPPEDQIMSDLVDQVTTIRFLPWVEAVKSGKVRFLDPSAYEAYLEVCRKQSLIPAPKSDELRIVFTPLHGVGEGCAGKVLEAQGFQPIYVPEQREPNGQFPNVTKTPNPEVPECLDRAEELARQVGADLVIATDPDADRIGGMACTRADGRGPYRILTGQELCVLLTQFKLARLQSRGSLPPSPIVITTEVTTSLVTRVARHYNAQIVNDLLVGFKYHADVLLQLEQHGQYGDVTGSVDDFIIATEESHGILATPAIRDKDSACAALLLAELALHLKRQERTIPEFLADLTRQFGYFRNELLNIVLPGVEGKQLMARMMDDLRAKPPKNIAGIPVREMIDLQSETSRFGPIKGQTDRAARNLLIFRLGSSSAFSEAKICLRPSGTEPKAKAYLEVGSAPCVPGTADADWQLNCQQIDRVIQQLATAFLSDVMGRVGLSPAPGADRLSR